MLPPVFRFAPSPNGELHLGHAYSALFTAEAAKAAGGRFLLRIEDIDRLRCSEQFVSQMMEDLAWLGLTWETPVRRQSQHMVDYRAAADQLLARGLLYPCFCSRSDVAQAAGQARDPDGSPLYPGTCRRMDPRERERRLALGKPHSLRINIEKAVAVAPSGLTFHEGSSGTIVPAAPQKWGDVILVRRDIGTSYHLAVVVDDALQRVSHVTRGRDLYEATHIHRLLQALLDCPEPLYHHHALVSDEAGRKLSKSARDRSLRSLRAAGVSAAKIRDHLGFGHSPSTIAV